MSRAEHLVKGVTLYLGDCRNVLPRFVGMQFDACVTDPPYGLGFMGKGWDHGVPDVAYWQEIFRTLKPGAHLLAFGGTRTYHRMACAIEDAGFEIRDTIMWVYGSGFPKSLDVSRAIDKAAGAVRDVLGQQTAGKTAIGATTRFETGYRPQLQDNSSYDITAPATDDARQWDGWGTALKPAVEPIVLARKPLSEKTVAANVLKWGTGALNIDGCRVTTDEDLNGGTYVGERREIAGTSWQTGDRSGGQGAGFRRGIGEFKQPPGRWPANLIHDGSDEVIAGFPESSVTGNRTERSKAATVNGTNWLSDNHKSTEHLDSGSAARFFYNAKASKADRAGSKHPTVKPLDLMQYLVRLVTPKGGTVLDPFAGTGTTAEAAFREGMSADLIEREEEYCADIRRRMALASAGPDERQREALKAAGKANYTPLPLFGGAA